MAAPLAVTAAFQNWVMVCPLGNVQVTRHPAIGTVPLLATVTSTWKPPGHELTVRYVAAQARPVGAGADVGGTVVLAGALVGGREVVGTVLVGGALVGGRVELGGAVVGGREVPAVVGAAPPLTMSMVAPCDGTVALTVPLLVPVVCAHRSRTP